MASETLDAWAVRLAPRRKLVISFDYGHAWRITSGKRAWSSIQVHKRGPCLLDCFTARVCVRYIKVGPKFGSVRVCGRPCHPEVSHRRRTGWQVSSHGMSKGLSNSLSFWWPVRFDSHQAPWNFQFSSFLLCIVIISAKLFQMEFEAAWRAQEAWTRYVPGRLHCSASLTFAIARQKTLMAD